MATEGELLIFGLIGLVSLLISAYILSKACGYVEKKGRKKSGAVIAVIASYALVLVINALSSPYEQVMIDAFRRNVAVFFGITGIIVLGLSLTGIVEEALIYLGRKDLSSAIFRAAKIFVNDRLSWTIIGVVFLQNILPPFVYSGILSEEISRSLITGLLGYVPHLVSLLLLYYWIRCIIGAFSFGAGKAEAKPITKDAILRPSEEGGTPSP